MAEILGFPGQGADWLAVISSLRGVRDASPGNQWVAQLGAVTGVADWSAVDPADTQLAQPAIYCASLIGAAEAADSIDSAVGHSFGELAALVYAGSLTFEDGLGLAQLRGQLGSEAQQHAPGVMVAVLALDRAVVDRLRTEAIETTGQMLEVAVVNHSKQVVLTGDDAAVTQLEILVSGTDGRATRLPIGGPFHTSRMDEAASAYEHAAAKLAIKPPRIPVVFSSGGGHVEAGGDTADVPRRLGRSLVDPVDWPDTLARCRALGIESGIDAGPGNTLVRISKKAGMVFRSPGRARQ